LLAAVHRAETAFVESLEKYVLANGSPEKVDVACHPRAANVTPAIRRLLGHGTANEQLEPGFLKEASYVV